jgi:hypothetical protein
MNKTFGGCVSAALAPFRESNPINNGKTSSNEQRRIVIDRNRLRETPGGSNVVLQDKLIPRQLHPSRRTEFIPFDTRDDVAETEPEVERNEFRATNYFSATML